MVMPSLLAAALLSAAVLPDPPAVDPMRELFARLAKLDSRSGASDFAAFVHPQRGADVDVSSEGATAPVMVHVDAAAPEKTFDKAVRPLIAEGLFKSVPKCSPVGKKFLCTLQTPASLPRICTLEALGSKWHLTRIEWVREEPGQDDGEDDDLPM